MPIYTKKGDGGKTSTLAGPMGKNDLLVETLGSVDELNSWIGFCRAKSSEYSGLSKIEQVQLSGQLKNMQRNLMDIDSFLAGSKKRLRPNETRKLEVLIDKLTKELPRLSNFVYPMGDLQVARAIVRRCERRVVNYQLTVVNNSLNPAVKYLNRLSDALFTVARWVNYKIGREEEIWK